MKVNEKKAEESLRKVMKEGEQPSVENLMLALNQANGKVRQMQAQLAQMADACRDMELRLVTTEFKHRLEFLWKVLFTEDAKKVFGEVFVEQCNLEFKEMMFPPVPQPEDKEDK